MKEGFGLVLFLVALPALIALGHDFYLFYLVNEDVAKDMDIAALTSLYGENRPGRGFNFSSFGFIWTHHAPDNFRETFQSGQSGDTGFWASIRPYLSWEAFPTFGIFAGVVYALSGLYLFGKKLGEKRIRNR